MPRNAKKSWQGELRYLFPAWCVCVLLPLPLILFRHSPAGRSYALMCFSLGCAILAAYAFRRDPGAPGNLAAPVHSRPRTWRERILPLALALLAATLIFSLVSLGVNDAHDYVTPMLAFMALVPALGIVPYLVMVTRRPFAGVLFSVLLVGSLKTPIGAFVVHTFFPSHFEQALDADGSLIMPTPWSHPNLLVWWFYAATAAISIVFHLLGARKFRASCAQSAQ